MVARGNFGDCNIGLPEEYFRQRSIYLDCRGPITISSKAHLSADVCIHTGSHPIKGGYTRRVVLRPVVIEAYVWICARVILYNCTIGESAIVALGSVVRSRVVPPRTLVEGNPAKAIAHLVDGVWIYFDSPRELKRQ